jgi:O-antigen/teichoic acid export membrane protein
MIGSPPAAGERCFDGGLLAVGRPPRTLEAERVRLATGAGVGMAGKVGGRLLVVAGHVLVARTLGAEAFGLFAVGWTVLAIGSVLSPLGLQHGVIRYGAPHWRRDPARLRGVVLQSLALAAAGAAGAALLLWLAAPALARHLFHAPQLAPVLRGFAPALFAAALLKVVASASRISQRAHWSVLSEDVAQGLALLAFLAWFLPAGRGLAGAVDAATLALFVALGVAALCLVPALPDLREPVALRRAGPAPLLSFSLAAAVAAFATLALPWVDRLMVAVFRPPSEVGVYQAASQISLLFAMILGSFGAIFAPMISRLHKDGDSARLRDLYAASTRWALYVATPGFLVVLFAGGSLLHVLFGPQFAAGYRPLVLLALGQLANVATGVVGLMLMMTGRQRLWLALTASALALSLVLDLLLIPRFGAAGAACATGCSLALLFVAGLLLVSRKLHCWPYDRRSVRALAAAGPVALVLGFWSRLGLPPWPDLLVSALVAVVGFYGLLALFGLDDDDRELVRALSRRTGGEAVR